jgi:tetratricopeptide (TPR) repeat protein
MYQLASGLVTDPKASALVENRIADLEKALPSAESPAAANRNRTAAEAKNHLGNGTEPSPQSTRKAGLHTDKTKPSKPAAPVGIGASLRAIVPRVVVAGIESHTALDDAARTRVLEKLSPEATELYRVGLEYLEKAEARKAQLRFEDALQIARRNRNPLGEGWLLLEIGRTQADLGDHVRALHSFERSLSIFNRLKATDETILSLIEMGFSSKAGGLNQKAASFYAKARDSAASSGNQKLAEVLGRTLGPQTPKPDQAKIAAAPSAEAAKEPIKEPGRKVTHDPKEKKEQASSAAEVKSRGLEEVGRGPLEWATSDKGKKKAQTVANLPAFKPPTTSRLAPPTGPRESEQPRTNNDANRQPSTVTRREQDPSFVTASVPTRPTIEADLAALRRLRKSRDETKMIDVLERLANGYQQTSQHEQALLCLSAALALREKRAGKGGMEDLLLKRGLILERLGRTAPAIEDYTRCMALARVEGKQALRESASLRASQLAQKMNLDSKALMAALGRLWKARIEGDEQSETRAFHQVGALYQAAGMLSEAVNYYERAAASMAVQKAWLLEKMGKKEQADQLRSEAVGAFKKLDYSRYLRMIKKPESISRP